MAGMIELDRLEHLIGSGEVRWVWAVIVGNSGQPLGKLLPAEVFQRKVIAGGGMPVPLVGFGLDIEQELLAGTAEATGVLTGIGDMWCVADPDTIRMVPWEEATALCILDSYYLDDRDQAVEFAPRNILKAQVDALAQRSLSVQCASELEFITYAGTPAENWENGYVDLTASSRYRAAYMFRNQARHSGFLTDLMSTMDGLGIEVEGALPEYGFGQYEVNMHYQDPVAMADHHMLHKVAAKVVSEQHGMTATFMAKPSMNDVGNGCHLHLSLEGADDTKLDQAIAGQVALTRELALTFAPNPNSYRRFQPEMFAPTNVAAGHQNRTVSHRIVTDDATGRRVEFRPAGADVNPYVFISGVIGASRHGIEQELDSVPDYRGYGWADESLPALPTSMPDAVDLFKESNVLRSLLGEAAHGHLVILAEEELAASAAANVDFDGDDVTEWEQRRYLERV